MNNVVGHREGRGGSMQGLVFVTWEKFLMEHFGETFVTLYRKAIKQAPSDAPLLSRTYTDEALQTAVEAAAKLAKTGKRHMLYEYGRYFMTCPLVNHLCGYIFSRVHNARDMILVMRKAHAQMQQGNRGMVPPLFSCIPLTGNPNGITVIYNDPHRLCPLLHGAIVGVGEYYKERAQVKERSCMLNGDKFCQFDVVFEASNAVNSKETRAQQEQKLRQQQTESLVLTALPYAQKDAPSLLELQKVLELRPLTLLEALNHLHFVGLISMQPARELMSRRYWRAQLLL
jgi:predicted hydrocarbon binding protein